jgi:hypothetical protein
MADEGGKKDGQAEKPGRKPGARIFPRTFSFVTPRVRVFSANLLRKKEE